MDTLSIVSNSSETLKFICEEPRASNLYFDYYTLPLTDRFILKYSFVEGLLCANIC